MNQRAEQADWARTPAAGFAAALLGLASITGIAWSLVHTQSASVPADPQPVASLVASETSRIVVHLVDLNSANAAELELLPGIGPVTAEAIVRDRTENGGFASIDDLDRVRGIGPKTIAGIRDRATIGGD
ncbi:MAG: ComEA family DNA-binding protein [Phycisphaerales bacterium]|nr:ComEA family DNA-binding protein [Phycisphaerales bacterium]